MTARNVTEVKEIQAHGEALYRYLFVRKDIYSYLSMEDVLKALRGFRQTTVNSGKRLEPHSFYNDGDKLCTILWLAWCLNTSRRFIN